MYNIKYNVHRKQHSTKFYGQAGERNHVNVNE